MNLSLVRPSQVDGANVGLDDPAKGRFTHLLLTNNDTNKNVKLLANKNTKNYKMILPDKNGPKNSILVNDGSGNLNWIILSNGGVGNTFNQSLNNRDKVQFRRLQLLNDCIINNDLIVKNLINGVDINKIHDKLDCCIDQQLLETSNVTFNSLNLESGLINGIDLAGIVQKL